MKEKQDSLEGILGSYESDLIDYDNMCKYHEFETPSDMAKYHKKIQDNVIDKIRSHFCEEIEGLKLESLENGSRNYIFNEGLDQAKSKVKGGIYE